MVSVECAQGSWRYEFYACHGVLDRLNETSMHSPINTIVHEPMACLVDEPQTSVRVRGRRPSKSADPADGLIPHTDLQLLELPCKEIASCSSIGRECSGLLFMDAVSYAKIASELDQLKAVGLFREYFLRWHSSPSQVQQLLTVWTEPRFRQETVREFVTAHLNGLMTTTNIIVSMAQ
jgi:hypothetical protein